MTTPEEVKTNLGPEIPVPSLVTDAGEKADEMIKELNKPADDADLKPEDQDLKPVEIDAKAEDVKIDAPPEETKDDLEAKPPEKKARTDWKQKYHVLQGKYNAEVPRLQSQVHGQASEVIRLQDEIKTLNLKPAVTDQSADDGNVTPESFEEYGPEFVALAKQNKELEKTVAALQKSVGSDKEDRNQEKGTEFYAKMGEYDDINNDPAFLTWLKTDVHPSFGAPRYDGFARAVNQFDSNRATAIFEEFKSLTPANNTDTTPAPNPKPIKNVQPPKGPAEQPNVELADGARTWTPATMKAHYDERTKGTWRGREKEWKTLEIDLLSAQGQGRLRSD